MARILIHTDAPQRHVAKLTEAFPHLQIESVARNSALADALERYQPEVMFSVNISSDAPFPRDAVLECSSLKWVCVGGSGTDHIGPWDAAQLSVSNSAGVASQMMAEYALGSFIHFNIDVPGLMKDQAARYWDRSRTVVSLDGKTILIVGLGSTGRALAKLAKAFGMTVIGTRARVQNTPNCDEVHGPDSLPQLWPRADYVAVCTPRLPSTKGLVNSASFDLMKPGAVLANVARGGVVDEAALIKALESGHLRGAAMDVFSTEPLTDNDPIWNAPNMLISPHCSAVHSGWEDASVDRFAANLERYLSGEALLNVVDPDRGY